MLEDINIIFNMKEIICDYELNIHKSIDEMLPNVDILGCFFHLAKAFKSKVDKMNMKSKYENNAEFRNFIKQCIALSSLPLIDIEPGLEWLKQNIKFEEDNVENFKVYFLNYIEKYWINGCFPPYIWSTWKRTSDYTNDNQEGFN